MFAKVESPITVEQFDNMDLPDDQEWELQGGQVVGMTFPNLNHRRLQQRLVDLLRPLFPNESVMMEYPFQVRQTLDKRSADVGVVDSERAKEAMAQGILPDAPEFVIEVLSPSSDLKKLKAYRRLCFAHGTEEFWIVDPDDNTIDAYMKGGKLHRIWEPGEDAPLTLFGTQVTIPVRDIFSGITLSSHG